MNRNRREFLLGAFGGAVALAGLSRPLLRAEENRLPPVRTLTHGPRFHWFGYYDKLEFDPTSRYVLGMEVDFEHRSPRAEDTIRVGMVDLASDDRWIELGESRAWGWQQGCMLQWVPGSTSEVIWNDRQEGRYVSHVLDVKTGKKRTLPAPIYALSPDGRWAICPDFRRLADTRPGYGYPGLPDPYRDVLGPEESGIWRMELATGQQNLIVSLAEAARIPYAKGDLTGAKHWFNHLLVSPDGARFTFLHRWSGEKGRRRYGTRMLTADADGGNIHVLDPHGETSHFIWRGPRHILAWAWHPSQGRKFYLYEDRTENVKVVAPEVMIQNGHCTYLPGTRWILNDTYPDSQRNQNVYLYNVESGERRSLGRFHSPDDYRGEWRCDTHPRFSPDGRKVVIDSPHGGEGRQLHLIDIGDIVGA